MSFADGQNDVVVQPKKSGAGMWLLGGCGCLTLVVLVCGGLGAFFWFSYGQPAANYVMENIRIATESTEVVDKLGDPVTLDGSGQDQDGLEITNRYNVSGPNGSGVVIIKGSISEDGTTWTRKEAYLEVDGERIDIDHDADTSFEIEGV